MAGKKKQTRKVNSLRDVERLIEMHGRKKKYTARIHGLHLLFHAGSIHKLPLKQIAREEWTVQGIQHLEPLVDAHRAIAASSRLLDEIIREMVAPDAGLGDPADPILAPGGPFPADLVLAPGVPVPADPDLAPGAVLGANPDLAPGEPLPAVAPGAVHAAGPALAPRMLDLATRLMESGAAFGQVQLGSDFVRVLVHGLGAEIEEAGKAILEGRHAPAAALDNIRQVKRTLGQIWNMRVEAKDFKLM